MDNGVMGKVYTREEIDYSELRLLEGHLLHEVKRKGAKEFVKEYGDAIEDFKTWYTKLNFCYLLGLLEYLDPSFKYDESIKMDKYVVDYLSSTEVDTMDTSALDELIKLTLPSFLKRGILWDEVNV